MFFCLSLYPTRFAPLAVKPLDLPSSSNSVEIKFRSYVRLS